MTKVEQQALVTECRASGMTAKAWCEAKGIRYRQYVDWATKLNRDTQHKPQQWADVTMSAKTKLPNYRRNTKKYDNAIPAPAD